MHTPDDSFSKKQKWVAHTRRQKKLSENTFMIEGPFFLLSIHPSQLDDSPHDYTGHVTRNTEGSGIFAMAALLTALCYVMLCYVYYATKHKIYGVNSHK